MECRKFSWRNPYMDLVQTKPDLLISIEEEGVTRELINFIGERTRNARSTCCELGSGSGKHLIELAAQNPDSFHVGFELRYKRAFRTAEKAERRGIQNLLVIRGDAKLIEKLFSPQSIDSVYVNFPDPWHKKRWNKHRLLSENYLRILHKMLTEDGILYYKTDHREYFEQTLDICKKLQLFCVKSVTYDLYSQAEGAANISTEFENLFKYKGFPICSVVLKKFLEKR